jgi:hypothetical protein
MDAIMDDKGIDIGEVVIVIVYVLFVNIGSSLLLSIFKLI